MKKITKEAIKIQQEDSKMVSDMLNKLNLEIGLNEIDNDFSCIFRCITYIKL